VLGDVGDCLVAQITPCEGLGESCEQKDGGGCEMHAGGGSFVFEMEERKMK